MTEPIKSFPRTLAVLERGREDGLHRGAQIFVSKNQEAMLDAGWGESQERVPMDTETLMPWRSSTKPVVAMAVARLVERGGLAVDDPVARWIPEFAEHGKGEITVAHLLTHTAGMRAADLALREDMGWDTALRVIVSARPEPRTQPGGQAAYHMNATWYLLGEIIRRVDGRDCGRFVREEIFLPLGMEDCWIGLPVERFRSYGQRIGVMFVRRSGRLEPHPFLNTEQAWSLGQPGSNGRGPMRQLAKFYETLLAGRSGGPGRDSLLFQTATIRAWTSRQRTGMTDQTFRHVIDWGYGFILDSNRYGRETVPYGYGRHCSAETFGHSGSQSSCAFADPQHGLVVAWVCNGLPGESAHQQRARELNSAIYEDLNVVRAKEEA